MNLTLGDTRLIIDTCQKHGLLRNQAAYVLATSYWETARTMKPVREMGGEKYLRSKKYYPYVGMGYVQLTWLANYQKASAKLGVDFVKHPKLLLEAKHAVEILVIGMKEGWFTGKKLADYITLQRSDFLNARRIINGVDKKTEIAKIAKEYDADLTKAGYGAFKATPAVVVVPTPSPAPAPAQDGVKPDVILVDGPKKDETTVVVVPTPQNAPATPAPPTSKTGFAALAAIISALGVAAYNYFGG